VSGELIGLIPAAGKGLRLGLPYPKELYPIIRDNHYKPVAQYILENLVSSGVGHVVFVINETKHQLIGYFGDGSRFGCHISYVVQETREDNQKSTSPGLAHALDAAYHLVKGNTVLFGMADTIITPKNVFELILKQAGSADDALLGLFDTTHPEKFGMVEMDKQGQVVHIVDKPRYTPLKDMWGIIAWRPRFTEFLHEAIQSQGLSDFAQVLNSAISSGYIMRGIPTEGSYADLGTYEEIDELEKQYRAP
jgi:glucose-1-phosphate thymidylyltransferase